MANNTTSRGSGPWSQNGVSGDNHFFWQVNDRWKSKNHITNWLCATLFRLYLSLCIDELIFPSFHLDCLLHPENTIGCFIRNLTEKNFWTESLWVQPCCFKNVLAVKTNLQSCACRHRYTSTQKLDQTAVLCPCQDITPKQRGTSSYTRSNKNAW